MSGRILRFDNPAHRAAEVLLPWFVNGTLEGKELLLVEQHLKECARCQSEVDWLRELQAACASSDVAPNAAQSFQTVRRRLGESRTRWRLVPNVDGIRRLWRSTQPWARWAVATQWVAILALGALLVFDAKPTLYRALSAADTRGATTGSVVVVFNPRTTEAELRRMLRAAGARVVDGPTEGGAYILDLPADTQAAALKALRAEPEVVLAETLVPGRDH